MSVGMRVIPSVDQTVSDHYLNKLFITGLIFHMLIGLGKGKTPIDIGFTRSKVKVTLIKN